MYEHLAYAIVCDDPPSQRGVVLEGLTEPAAAGRLAGIAQEHPHRQFQILPYLPAARDEALASYLGIHAVPAV